MARKPIIAGNWKMNKGTSAEAKPLVHELVMVVGDVQSVDIVVCPPYTALSAAQEVLGDTRLALGAQDVFWKTHGAYTGQVSAPMLADIGVKYVIIAHSEVRGRFGVVEPDFDDDILRHFGETNASVNRKTIATLSADLIPIICVGETLSEREAGETDEVVQAQVKGALVGISDTEVGSLVFAYEPVWAIGTGKTCDAAEANRVCGYLRSVIADMYDTATAEAVRIQYGGSMKPDNALELLSTPHIDGGLIGGASLKATDFAAIVHAAAKG